MKNKTNYVVLLLLLSSGTLYAIPPGTITKCIKIDQFGYLREGKKVAVIVDPQTGYNAAESFFPGTGVNQYQVRRWMDDAVMYFDTLVFWEYGITHTQSGDKGMVVCEKTPFEIQRSFNGRDFITIGTAIAAPGQNTYTMNDYSFEAQSASVYYRIREKSKEGRDRFSSIVRLFTKRNDAISVYPNPARSTIVIGGRAETTDNMTFRIFDAAGILVKKENWQLSAGNFSKTLSVEDLPAGNYWLQAAGARNTKWIKLVKQ